MTEEQFYRKQIRGLLATLASAVGLAVIVVVVFVYYLGSPGTYRLSQVLISPQTLDEISFADISKKGGNFVFNKIEFVRAEASGRGWGRFAVSKESYREFYRLVDKERSILNLDNETVEQFNLVFPSTLTIYVTYKEKGRAQTEGMIFQEVQFLDQGDVFRILMRHKPADEMVEEWVYFQRPGIYQEVLALFAPTLKTS